MADGCFILQDDQAQAYSEFWDYTVVGTEKKGDLKIKQDVASFCLTAGVDSSDLAKILTDIALIYWAQQVRANKKTGSGEEIYSGDRLYYIVADEKVSPNHSGTIGVDYYFVGWAKKDASASATTVLMKFDGTMYANSDMA